MRIKSEKHDHNTPEKAPKMRYKVPVSLWLVENNQRSIKFFILITVLETKKIFDKK